jgi:hypothetical protein
MYELHYNKELSQFYKCVALCACCQRRKLCPRNGEMLNVFFFYGGGGAGRGGGREGGEEASFKRRKIKKRIHVQGTKI